MTKPNKSLDAALDFIVSKFNHPKTGTDELTPLTTRQNAEIRQRVSAMRAAAAALRATHEEGWTAQRAYRSTPNGSLLATTGARYRWRWAEPVNDGGTLLPLADALERTAELHAALDQPSPKARGRKADPFVAWLVREVAIACRDHGVAFTDHPTGRAANILRGVFERVAWAPRLEPISTEGIRRYLRMGRAAQRAGRTSILAWPKNPN